VAFRRRPREMTAVAVSVAAVQIDCPAAIPLRQRCSLDTLFPMRGEKSVELRFGNDDVAKRWMPLD
jgi:hypothetical protein